MYMDSLSSKFKHQCAGNQRNMGGFGTSAAIEAFIYNYSYFWHCVFKACIKLNCRLIGTKHALKGLQFLYTNKAYLALLNGLPALKSKMAASCAIAVNQVLWSDYFL